MLVSITSKRLLPLLAGLVFLTFTYIGSAQTSEQKLLINGKEFNQKECFKLSDLEKVAVLEVAKDSVQVEMALASGPLGKGGKKFASIDSFNSYDIKTWLLAERKTEGKVSMNADENGDSQTKLKARDGDRLLILIKKGEKNIKLYTILFCAD